MKYLDAAALEAVTVTDQLLSESQHFRLWSVHLPLSCPCPASLLSLSCLSPAQVLLLSCPGPAPDPGALVNSQANVGHLKDMSAALAKVSQ